MSTTIGIQTTETQPFILLPAYVNGKGPFDFLLDTGAAMSIITEELASIIGVEGTEVKEALGAAGKKIEVPLGKLDSISIGETRVEDVRVGIMKELPKCVGRGVLGYNFVKEFALTIDYGSNLLTFTSPSDKKRHDRSLPTYVPLRLARQDRPILLVDVLINAQETYQFILDTGASQTVVSPELAQQMSIKDIKADSIIGAGGTTHSSVGIVKSLSVGEASLRNITVIVADIFSTLSQAVGTKFDGILGFNFLSKFKLEIDYQNERLRFEELVNTR
jgi:predicted aspartyl protease